MPENLDFYRAVGGSGLTGLKSLSRGALGAMIA
jgi:16S rRNA G966 N2-methylase RsmD